MKMTYRYNKLNVVMNFGPIPMGLAFVLLIALVIAKSHNIPILAWFVVVLAIPIPISIVLIINLLKVVVTVDDAGVNYESLFKHIKVKWHDILQVKRIYVVAGRYGGPPRDLQLQLINNKKLNILNFILNSENANWDEEGMPEFETTLQRFGKITITS